MAVNPYFSSSPIPSGPPRSPMPAATRNSLAWATAAPTLGAGRPATAGATGVTPGRTVQVPPGHSLPEETQEGEASTTDAISTPEPRTPSDWTYRLALFAIAVVTLCTAGFLAARIAFM